MTRRLFGARPGRPEPKSLDAMDWSQLPIALRLRAADQATPALIPAQQQPAGVAAAEVPADQREEELFERVATFRTAVSDSLYETSKDYQILCNLMQAELTACDEIAAEMRRRLAGNIHYAVLTKLDEVHALIAAHIERRSSGVSAPGG